MFPLLLARQHCINNSHNRCSLQLHRETISGTFSRDCTENYTWRMTAPPKGYTSEQAMCWGAKRRITQRGLHQLNNWISTFMPALCLTVPKSKNRCPLLCRTTSALHVAVAGHPSSYKTACHAEGLNVCIVRKVYLAENHLRPYIAGRPKKKERLSAEQASEEGLHKKGNGIT